VSRSGVTMPEVTGSSPVSSTKKSWGPRGSQVIRGISWSSPSSAPSCMSSRCTSPREGQLPELKRVIVGFGDGIAMEETLDGAIARVFGDRCRRRGRR